MARGKNVAGASHRFGVLPALVLVGMLVALTAPARAEVTPRFSALFSREVWLAPEVGQHGAIFAFVDIEGLPWGSHLEAGWILDTLQVGWDRIRLYQRDDLAIEAGLLLKAEFAYAGVYPDFYRRGLREPERGFLGNYVLGRGYVKIAKGRHHFLDAALSVRRWFFWRDDGGIFAETDPLFTLPPEAWVFEPRLHYTYWNVGDDRSTWERHRLFPRIDGVALGAAVGFDARTEVHPWGLDETRTATDPRNQPEAVGLQASAWVRMGWQLAARVRTQAAFYGGWTRGADDLNRVRAGAMSPYALPLPGRQWGAQWSDRAAVLEWSWHVRVWGEIEVGALGDVVLLNDPQRTGADGQDAAMVGAAVFGDLRFGNWQVDLRVGWSPSLHWQTDVGHWSVLGAVGWSTGG